MLPELRSSCPETSLRPREETLAGMSPRQPEGWGGGGGGRSQKKKKGSGGGGGWEKRKENMVVRLEEPKADVKLLSKLCLTGPDHMLPSETLLIMGLLLPLPDYSAVWKSTDPFR